MACQLSLICQKIGVSEYVLASMSLHIAMVLPLPISVCKSIEKCIRNFWRLASLDKSKSHFVNWGKVCLPKLEGGPGIHRLQEINSACFISLGWRAVSSSSMWATSFRDRFMRKCLFRFGGFSSERLLYMEEDYNLYLSSQSRSYMEGGQWQICELLICLYPPFFLRRKWILMLW